MSGILAGRRKTVPTSEPSLSRFLADRKRVLVIDIAALKSLLAMRESELETIMAAEAVRHSDG